MKRSIAKFALAVAATVATSGAAQAAVTVVPQSSLTPSSGYYTNDLGQVMLTTGGGNANGVGDPTGRNDDGFAGPISLGFNYTLYGTTYNSIYINNNGNVSFGAGISAYIPTGPTGANAPVISPWFGDVDTRGALSGVVHYQFDTAGQLVVTWDHVGYFSVGDNLLDSFQLILRSDAFNTPSGEGQIGFFYGNMGWEQTGTSQVAAIGFGDGTGANAEVLDGSASQSNLNQVVANHHIWFDQNLAVIPPDGGVPEPATWAMLIIGFGATGAMMRRRKAVSAAA